MTSYFTAKTGGQKWQKIAVRAAVTAVEATLALLLTSNLTELTVDTAEAAAITGIAAGLSVIYNSLRSWLDSSA